MICELLDCSLWFVSNAFEINLVFGFLFFFFFLTCCLVGPDTLAASSPLRSDLSLDENSNSSSTTISRKNRPTQLTLTNQTSPSTSIKSPCLQTDIDAVYRSSSPLSLPRPSPIASDFELSVLERFDQLLASLGTASSGWSPHIH